MGLIDGIGGDIGGMLAGGAGAMVPGLMPGMEMLGVISKGIDLAKGLFDKGDVKGTQDILQLLNEIVSKLSGQKPGGQASEPQPFTSPQSSSSSSSNAQPDTSLDLTITVTPNAAPAQPLSYGTLPLVDGSPQQDQMITNLASARVDGSGGAKSRALTQGSDEWMTTMVAMQQNPNIRYNADTQRFTMKMPDGSSRDVCSLQEAENVINQNGGMGRANPQKSPALGSFLNQKAGEAQNAGAAGTNVSNDEMQKLLDSLKKMIKQFEDAQQMMPGSFDINLNSTAA